jgi:hypothetical protein
MRLHHAAVLGFLFTGVAFAAEFHVDLMGRDTNIGSKEAPFATLTAARDAVRAMKQSDGLPEGGVTVWIHGGEYRLPSEGFVLTKEDSGTADQPILYRAAPEEEVRLIGGVSLPAEAFRSIGDASDLERLEPAARDHTLCADLKVLGVTEYGEFPDQFVLPPVVPELFFDGERMPLAEWPNEGWAHVASVVESGPAPWRKHESDRLGVFEYEGDRPNRWNVEAGVWLQGYWCFDWSSETIRVKSIDTKNSQITLLKQHHYGIGSGNPAPRRFRAVNLLEELDRPGEYFLDRNTGRLYFWPPKPLEGSEVFLSTLRTPLVSMTDASFVAIEGCVLEAGCHQGVSITGGRENRIAGCVIRNMGHEGIAIESGEKHRVISCDLYDLGTSGIILGGGDRKTLTPCGHEALNNHIHHVSSRRRTHAYPIHMSGVGIHIANNLIHDIPHQAIGLSGNDHLIEFNEIHHSGLESDDCGAFYMGRNPSDRGNIIRHNFWHDTGSEFSHGSCAVYFDDGTGGQTVFGNVFYRAAGGNFGAVFVHGGHDNLVDNNLFIECKRAVGHAPWNDDSWNEWLTGDLWRNRLLEEVDITRAPFIDRYPDLEGFLAPGKKARVNRTSRNVAVKCESFAKGEWVTGNDWITEKDPGFVDLAGMDFGLTENSPVFTLIPDFERIPFDRIGLYKDEYRGELPIE